MPRPGPRPVPILPGPPLPVEAALPRLREILTEIGVAVLQAPTGSGKTTRVPLALLDQPWLQGRRVVMLEPRRLAARGAAVWMARLLGEEVGGRVGYRIRGDTRVGPSTRVEVVTEGVLTRMLQGDPGLEGVGVLIFDEFHERNLHGDLGLALALEVRGAIRADLRLLVMSATLDPAPVAAILGGAPVVSAGGRLHPVRIQYRYHPVRGGMERSVAAAVQDAMGEVEGDLLVFLPGAAEIRRTRERLLEGELPPGVRILPLHGGLSGGAQEEALAPAPLGGRKVILATDIAETSLTIEGIRGVVDAGWARVPRFDPRRGMGTLATVRVSRASADQRAGRAGRTAPGVAYRLWTRGEHAALPDRPVPEILEADLTPLALELAAWGTSDLGELAWLDSPPAGAFRAARILLGELGALDGKGRISAHGFAMAESGLHPRIAHMVVTAVGRGGETGRLACDLAAILEDRDLLRWEGPEPPDPDLSLRLSLLRGAGPWRGGADRGALHRARGEADRLRRRFRVPRPEGGEGEPHPTQVGALLALAYPDRVARARSGGGGRFLLSGGGGAVLSPMYALAREPWLVAASLQGQAREGTILLAAPLDESTVREVAGEGLRREERVGWDPEAGAVHSRWEERLGALLLRSGPLANPDPARITAVLLQALREAGPESLGWSRESRELLERLRFLRGLDPSGWPDLSDAGLVAGMEQWLAPWLPGMRTLEEVRRLDLAPALRGMLPPGAHSGLDRLAPAALEVPSGSRIRVDYSDPSAPVLAVRLQELFGLGETPAVGGGRVPLTLHLLSPARRPVQVTRDLASFWRSGYPEVRKELRGRYPKHAWPEDPLAAEPVRGVPRRR